MGDSGSLALGGAMAGLAVMTQTEVLLILLAIISAILHIVLAYTFSDYW